ncbi:MAG: HepT-like ribonuclease domain-containing protein [Chitinophagales bacterium]|nr:HepT-like ribonuclease domain-containing protein [Chitinophagales bacterium]
MREEILVWLHDIFTEINAIEEYFQASGGKSFANFSNNRMLKKAVERSFEIIGEAMKRVLHKDANISISNAQKIVAFRNKISHEYDRLDDETLYSIVIAYLPQLREDIKVILEKYQP